MTQLEQWLESGLYVFVVLSEQGYQGSESSKSAWPDAVRYGDYRLINFDKSNAESFYDYLITEGYNPQFGVSNSTPMLLTWGEAIEFTKQFASDEDI